MSRGLQVRFFDETPHAGSAFVVQRCAGFNVAKTGFRSGRHHTEGHQVTAPGQCHGMLDRLLERIDIDDQMVGGHDQHDRLVAMQGLEGEGGGSDGRRRVAPRRLQQEVPAMTAQVRVPKVILALEVVFAVGHRDDIAPAVEQVRGTPIGLAQKRLAVRQGHERFGMAFTRHRPQPCPGTAGENHGNQHGLLLGDAFHVRIHHHADQGIQVGFGFQPSTRWALAGLPSSTSTSAGRKNAGSIFTKSR